MAGVQGAGPRPGYRLLRSKTVDPELASVVAMYVDGPLGGLDATLTGTFQRPGGSTFTRSVTTTTLDNGQAPQVLFGPYAMRWMTSLRIDGPAVHGHPVSWRF